MSEQYSKPEDGDNLAAPESSSAQAKISGERLATATIFTDLTVAAWALTIAGAKEIYRILTGESQFSLATLGFFAVIAVIGTILNLAYTTVRWLTTRYILSPDELRYDTGLIFKTSKRIALSRIQSVDSSQPFMARLLSVVKLHINCGGDDTTELAYLTRQRAEELASLMLRYSVNDRDIANGQRLNGGGACGANIGVEGETVPATDTESATAELYRVPLRTILQGVALSNTVWFWLISTPLLWASTWLLPDWELWNLVFKGGLVAIPGFIAIYLWQAITPQANFTLTRTERGLTTERGLLNRIKATVPEVRVQAVVISQPLWWRLLGRYRVSLDLLATLTVGDDHIDAAELLPIGSNADALQALGALWPQVNLNEFAFTGPPKTARWLSPLAHSWLGWSVTDNFLALRYGFFNRRLAIIPHTRIQEISVSAGPLQRRINVASVTANLSGAGHTLDDIPTETATALAFAETARLRER